MLIPLLHCQLYIGFVWLFMDLVDDLVPGQIFTHGRQWKRDADEYVLVPPDLESMPPRAYELARTLGRSVLLLIRFDGVQPGTAVRHMEPLAKVNKSRLIEWHKMPYMVTSVRPDVRHTFQIKGSFIVMCFFMVYRITDGDYEKDHTMSEK